MVAVTPHSIAFALGLAALLFLLGMLAVWDMPDSAGRHWVLLFGIVILPGLAILLGASTAVDDAKRPEFCGSCHVMHPFINDLRNADSKTLAAAHYQNRYILEDQCYTCHTDYGFFGPVRAKLTGVRHLWNYETGNYTLPIRIRSPYRIANCLHCHGESKVYREKHEELQAQLAAGDVGCLDCHAPAHPEERGS
jgi:nitrate/TMAO reductase-like tetraheme cytochrome c subunit